MYFCFKCAQNVFAHRSTNEHYCGSYHGVVPPGEYGEAVLVLTELLLDLRPHAFRLAIQHDEDGPLTNLQQVQQALPVNTRLLCYDRI